MYSEEIANCQRFTWVDHEERILSYEHDSDNH